MAKMSITFSGFDDLATEIDRMGGNLTKAVNDALEDTQKIVKDNLTSAASVYISKGRKGYATGKMYDAIITDTRIDWAGTTAEVNVGFSTNGGATKAGFMHSIFIMYGTPRMAKDQKVYNAIKGTKTQKDIAKVQEETLKKYLNLEG